MIGVLIPVNIHQQDNPIKKAEVAHAHEQEVFQYSGGVDAVVDILADIVQRFQIEVAGFEFRLNPCRIDPADF